MNLDGIKTSLRRKIKSDLTKILAENKKEIAHGVKKTLEPQNIECSDSEGENTFIAPTSTPIKSEATAQKNTQLVGRNRGTTEYWN